MRIHTHTLIVLTRKSRKVGGWVAGWGPPGPEKVEKWVDGWQGGALLGLKKSKSGWVGGPPVGLAVWGGWVSVAVCGGLVARGGLAAPGAWRRVAACGGAWRRARGGAGGANSATLSADVCCDTSTPCHTPPYAATLPHFAEVMLTTGLGYHNRPPRISKSPLYGILDGHGIPHASPNSISFLDHQPWWVALAAHASGITSSRRRFSTLHPPMTGLYDRELNGGGSGPPGQDRPCHYKNILRTYLASRLAQY